MIGYTWGQHNSVAVAVLETPHGLSHEEYRPMSILDHTPTMPGEQEEWRPVVGWVELYAVSDLGRVRRVGANKGARVGRILVKRPNSKGYPNVSLHAPNWGRVTRLVHHLVAEAFLGARPAGMVINHRDFDRANAAARNLEYVTQAGNLRYSADHGRPAGGRGERQAAAKLTDAQVVEIRAAKESIRTLATRFGVKHQTIQKLKAGKTWKHVA